MYQTPTAIWNRIAATQTLQHDPWKTLFALDTDPMLQALAKLETELEAKGADARVTRGYLLVCPLLQENGAISNYLQEHEGIGLRSSLPEVVTIPEAVSLATEDFRLNDQQQRKLRSLLQQARRAPLLA